MDDRRRRRTYIPAIDLRYWLEAIAIRHELVGLVLADWDGLVVQSYLPIHLADEVAALAPYLAVGSGRVSPHYWRTFGVSVLAVRHDSDVFYICAVGRRDFDPDHVWSAEPGIRRILGEG